MARLNDCKFIGNVGKDPAVRVFTGGTKIATTSIAVTEKWTDESGQPQENTEWVPVVFNAGLAEVVERFIKKGDTIYVSGKFHTRSYTNAEGVQKYVTEIIVRDLQLLGKKQEASPSPAGRQPQAAPAAAVPPVPAQAEAGGEPSDDLPF